jgi:hypothetical protein
MTIELPETEWLLHMPARPYEPAWTSSQAGYEESQMIAYGEACAAAERETQEPVAWQYRWLNPADMPDQKPEWLPIEPYWNQTVQEKIAELEAYRYNGKPCYEVRALYAVAIRARSKP